MKSNKFKIVSATGMTFSPVSMTERKARLLCFEVNSDDLMRGKPAMWYVVAA